MTEVWYRVDEETMEDGTTAVRLERFIVSYRTANRVYIKDGRKERRIDFNKPPFFAHPTKVEAEADYFRRKAELLSFHLERIQDHNKEIDKVEAVLTSWRLTREEQMK